MKNYLKEADTTSKLKIPTVHGGDEIPLIAARDVSAAAAAVLQHFDRYAGQVRAPLLRARGTCQAACNQHVTSSCSPIMASHDDGFALVQALLLVTELLTVDGLAAEFSKVLGKQVQAPFSDRGGVFSCFP